jgi:hypothetical protein
MTELERSLRALRLSGMGATLQVRALAVSSHEMDFIEAFSWLVQDDTRCPDSSNARISRTSTSPTTRPSRGVRCSSWPP